MDLNADGYQDILSGSYSSYTAEQMAGHFQVLFGDKDGKFTTAEELKGTNGKVLEIQSHGEQPDIGRICTRPTAVDWDSDGDLDLIVGNFEGSFYFFEGLGKGKFSPESQLILCEGKPLKIEGIHSDPFCVDLDGGGVVD